MPKTSKLRVQLLLEVWLILEVLQHENWLCLGNSCIYYACHTRDIYQVLPYSVDYKARQYLVNVPVISFGIKDLSVNIWNARKAEK